MMERLPGKLTVIRLACWPPTFMANAADHLKSKGNPITKRIVTISVLSAALLLQPVYGGLAGVGEAMAGSTSVNFTGNTTKDIGVPSGKTDVYPTCYSLNNEQYLAKTGAYFRFNCTSSEVSLTCNRNQSNNDHCVCHNGTKKTHTVKVHMDGNCHDPS